MTSAADVIILADQAAGFVGTAPGDRAQRFDHRKALWRLGLQFANRSGQCRLSRRAS